MVCLLYALPDGNPGSYDPLLPLFLDAGKMTLFQHITWVLLHVEIKELGEAL